MTSRIYFSILLLLVSFHLSFSQMVVGQDTLIGNEWIQYDHRYFKFSLDHDGVYRISKGALEAAGVSETEIIGANLRVYNMGEQVPLYVSTDGIFGTNDFVEFYGFKNRSELDRFLFRLPDQDLLNPDYSIYTDRNAYYLAYEGTDEPLRVNVILNDLTNLPAQEDFYLHNERINYHSDFTDPYFGVGGGGAVSYSSFMHSEGFSKAHENSSITQVPTLNRYAAGPDASLRIRMASTNFGAHIFDVSLNDQLLGTIELSDLEISETSYSIPLSLLTDNNQLKITSQNVQSRHTLTNIELIYPRTTTLATMGHATIILTGKPGNQHLVLPGFNSQEMPPVIYTYDGKNRMTGSIDVLNNVKFKWPETQENLRLEIIDPVTGIQSLPALAEKTFVDFSADDTEYIIITHPDLMQTGTGSDYIQYRSSPAGDSYRAKAYSILDIYDQFGYGIEKHPQAIRNFVEFFDRAWPSAKMIFIVGRGIEYHRSRIEDGTWEESFFVPTFGRPGSDNLLAANNWDLVPRFPIGRLAIINSQGIATYLEKVREHDQVRFAGQNLEEKAWIKNVIHIGGGKSSSEQANFQSVLNSLGEDLTYSDFGAKVSFFQKKSTDIIGESQSKQIERLLQEGSTIINYLGHSSASTFEFTINDPAEWDNKGRYPIFSAMGCSAGQIHGPIFSLSDRYTHIPDEGAIAFISGSGSQFTNALVNWARPWYEYIGEIGYGGTLGESILYGLGGVGNFVNPELTGSNQHRYLLEQQTFQGDPALKLHPMPGPDYLVDHNSVSITPEILSTKLDSFDVSFTIANIGRNLDQDVAYTIHIKRADGHQTEIKTGQILANTYESIITAKLPLLTDGKAGAYRLLIRLDPANLLDELPAPQAEDNNFLTDNLNVEGIEFYVVDNLISASYPPDFAIVTRSQPELVATSSNSFIKRQNIVLEMDTTALFNSPSLFQERFINHSATLKWTPQFNYVPDRVYYWRVSTDSISPEQGFIWSKKSFVYKPGTPNGWNQSHFQQLTDNILDQILPDSSRYQFKFANTVNNLRILNRYQNTDVGEIPFGYIDGVLFTEFFSKFTNAAIHAFVIAIDPVTGKFMTNPNPGLYGSFNNLTYDTRCFAFRTDLPESRQALINFVENIVPNNFLVFIYTYQRPAHPSYFPEQWESDEPVYGKSIFSMIEEQYPTSTVRTLATTGSKPYIVFFQKGKGGIEELIAVDTAEVISVSYDIRKSLREGIHISRLIGPSSKWSAIQWDYQNPSVDTVGVNTLSAWAISSDLSDTILISSNIISQDTSIASLDAKAYPFIQLAFSTEDSVGYHPADILYWRVLYEGYPEFVINPDIGFEFESDTLFQGQQMNLTTFVENISDYDVDSLPVSLVIINDDNTTSELNYTIDQLNAHSNASVDFAKTTAEMSGNYNIVMEINPDRVVNEYNYSNNIGILGLYVEGDALNPVLDVTFDGQHILDGDLVSSKPVIAIQLHDENQYLRLDDTSSFSIFLKYPSEFQPRRISFSEDWVQFIEASGSGQNIASVELSPEFLEDGIYELQVKAIDASGNLAGDNDYFISFEVINAESVSHLYNYPNPFSTSTRFVYTLTGDGSPPYYKIQIMSISGRIVREITQQELGPLTVGTHMTEYVWDGMDDSGQKLAAGVYLYRMIVKNEDLDDFERYETSGDSKFFKKGWGKLVILR